MQYFYTDTKKWMILKGVSIKSRRWKKWFWKKNMFNFIDKIMETIRSWAFNITILFKRKLLIEKSPFSQQALELYITRQQLYMYIQELKHGIWIFWSFRLRKSKSIGSLCSQKLRPSYSLDQFQDKCVLYVTSYNILWCANAP